MESLNKSAHERSQRLAEVLYKERTYGLGYSTTTCFGMNADPSFRICRQDQIPHTADSNTHYQSAFKHQGGLDTRVRASPDQEAA